MALTARALPRGPLTADHVAAFERDGFVVVRGLYDQAEMRQMTAWTDEVQALPEIPGKYMMYFEKSLLDRSRVLNRLENFAPYHRGFEQLFTGRMQDAVAQLVGEPAVLFKDKINFKMSGGDGFKPHQDQQAGWGTYADFFVTAMVSIDPTTVENGCLELAAGHHKSGIVGSEWKPLDGDTMSDMDFVSCPTQPGDAVFFDSYAPHRSGPNLTGKPRRVLYVTYNRASAGDHRHQYYADKRASYPPDIERDPGKTYIFRV
jgi:ectoine hydroxylase-related dioxygenase (phytanoyl-CoA dioxygenase family)